MSSKSPSSQKSDSIAELRQLLQELRQQLEEREEPKGLQPKDIAAHVAGAAMAHKGEIEGIRAEVAQLREEKARDAQADARAAESNARVEAALLKLTEALHALIEHSSSPSTRTGVVDLPTGRVQMTITEKRERKKDH